MAAVVNRMWMKVTPDKYQLPLVVADSVSELARACNVTRGAIYSASKRYRSGETDHTSFIDVLPEE